jgi:hypothetical protein
VSAGTIMGVGTRIGPAGTMSRAAAPCICAPAALECPHQDVVVEAGPKRAAVVEAAQQVPAVALVGAAVQVAGLAVGPVDRAAAGEPRFDWEAAPCGLLFYLAACGWTLS